MLPLYDYGIRLILFLQSFTWLEAPMRFFTFIGTPDFFVFVLPVVYWCIDASLGLRIGFILLFSNGLNEIAKLALQGPRPYWISAGVRPLSAEASFGAPSGHAQIGAGVWGVVAAAIRRPWAWTLAVIVVFLVGLSRMYLAVHFPHDVLLGWLLGGLTLWGFLAFWDPVAKWLKQRSFAQQALIAAAVSLSFLLVDGVLIYSLGNYVVPIQWMSDAMRAGQPYPDPLSMEGVLTSSGAFLGFALGLAWIARRGGFRPSGSVLKRAACFLVGLLGMLTLYLGLTYLIPSSSTLIGSLFRLARYAAIGAWVSAGAPIVFRALKMNKG